MVGHSGSAVEAPGKILDLGPDVMVLDVRLPDGSGAQVCRDVHAVDPSITGLLLTSVADDDALTLSVLAGAAGFVIKLAGTHEIIDAVRRVGAGRPLLDSAMVGRITHDLAIRADNLQPPLTSQQADVLSLILEGRTDQQVADALNSTVASVRDDVALLMARWTSSPDLVDWHSSGRHRRDL